MRKIDEIIIHCSATEAGKDFKAKDIKQWHVKGNGWRDIGYHYVIDIDGTVEFGRPIEQVGAHTKGHNANSIGICYVGGLLNGKAHDTRTEAQKQSLKTLIERLKEKYPIVKISGHRDYANKACPCFDVSKEY